MKIRSLLLLLSCGWLGASAQIISFEDGVVPSSFAPASALSVTTARHKLGNYALQWNWAAGTNLTATNPTNLGNASKASAGGIYLWIYNPVARADALTFTFTDNATRTFSIPFSLNFTGWRCLDAAFSDMSGYTSSSTAVTTMKVIPPSTGSGTLYFDHLEFQNGVKWDRMSDAQCTVKESPLVFHFEQARLQADVPAGYTPTSAELTALHAIEQKVDAWYLSTNRYASDASFQSRLSAIQAKISYVNSHSTRDFPGNGTAVSGEGLYPEYASIDGASAAYNSGWQPKSLLSQASGTFTVDFDAVPNKNAVSAVVGMSAGIPAAYGDLAIALRFNSSGNIDALNGSAYQAQSTIPYAAYLAQYKYHFTVTVNLTAHTYSATVTPPGGTAQTLATNYAFASTQGGVTRLNYWCAYMDPATGAGASLGVSGFTLNGVGLRKFKDINSGTMLWYAYDYKLNASATSRTRWLNLLDWYADQGWADGSALGGLMGEKLSSAGYIHTVLMMRNELSTAQKTRELGNLRWYGLWGNVIDSGNGENTDQIRALSFAKLAYALLQPTDGQKVSALKMLKSYLDRAYGTSEGFGETFKPDFSGYHHNGVYNTQYYPDALYTAALLGYLLDSPSFGLAPATYDQLKNNLLQYRATLALYDAPVATTGRFPLGTTYLNQVLPAYAYLGLTTNPHTGGHDAAVIAAFKRLWQPTQSPVSDAIAAAGTGISLKTTLGEIETCLDAAADTAASAEADPVATFYSPYSGLFVSRSATTHVSVKGFSKYIWDYEADSANNIFGRYQSNGQLEYTDMATGSRNNAFGDSNWDWNRLPGTTTRHLAQNIQPLVNQSAATSLLYTSGVTHRNFSDSTFLGGVALDAATGMFAMQLHDNAHDTTFRANKSVFVFGNVVACIGSNITDNQTSAPAPTETTILQQALAAGETISVLPQGTGNTIVRDNLGNRFVVVKATPTQSTAGSISAVVLNHGTNPTAGTYEYYMLMKGSQSQEDTYVNDATRPVKVMKQDATAHIVRNGSVSGYAIFAANTPLLDKNNTADPWIAQANCPSLAMFKDFGTGYYQLNVSDPDMHRPNSAPNLDQMVQSEINVPSAPFNYQITLNGRFQLAATDSAHALTLTHTASTTSIHLTLTDGENVPIHLGGPETWYYDGPATFNGTTDYLDFGTTPGSAASLTIAFFATPSQLANMQAVDKLPLTGTAGWSLKLRSNGDLWFRIGSESSTSRTDTTATGVYAPNTKVHIACTFSAGTANIYVNGQLRATKTGITYTVNNTTTSLRLAKPSVAATTNVYAGTLEQVKIYDRALTAAEIAILYAPPQ